MHDQIDVSGIYAGGGKRVDDSERLVVDRRWYLGDAYTSWRTTLDQDQVGERAPDIDAGDDGSSPFRSIFLSHARNP